MRKAEREKDPVAAGFRRARDFRKQGDRGALFRELLQLRELCADDPGNAIELADFFMTIRERTAVLEFFATYQARIAAPSYTELYLAWCAPLVKRKDSQERIGRLLQGKYGNFDFCMKLAQAAGEICGANAAMGAARQAIKCAASEEELLRAHYRLAHLLFIEHRRQEALAELKCVSVRRIAASVQAQRFAYLAYRCQDKEFGLEVVTAMLDRKPGDFTVTLYACKLMADGGQRREATAAIDKLFGYLVGKTTLTRDQYAELIAAARPLGFDPERTAIALALQAYPNDEAFLNLAAAGQTAERGAFAAKFPDIEDVPLPRSQGLFSRLRSRFSA